MKKQSRMLSTILAVALAIGVPGTAALADAWVVPAIPQGTTAVSVGEYGGFENRSVRDALTDVQSSGVFKSSPCPQGNTGQDKCDFSLPGVQAAFRELVPFCATETSENCVEGLTFIKPDGTAVAAKYVGAVTALKLPAVPEQHLFETGATLLFDAPGFPNAVGGTTYAVNEIVFHAFDRGTQVFISTGMNASVLPYTLKFGSHYHLNANPSSGCIWSEEGRCGILEDFAYGVTAKISSRVPSDITGWFRGRLTKSQIDLSKFSATNNRLEITGESVKVPRMFAFATAANTTADQAKMIEMHGGEFGPALFEGGNKYPFSDWGEFTWVENFRKIANDTAAGISTIWNVSTIDNLGQNPCLADKSKVLGIVNTNATLYNGVVPDFVNGQLTYKVAGLHFQPDGKTLNEGTYDLVMRSDVARCLYGFSKAPISATISVVGEGGESRVATTVVNEKDGWLHLAAYGFTFSSPTISVKLTQVGSTPSKKTTITCFKGKLTKKVTAVGPKCPSGYKKK
jgi:hypothetical protein